jgi:hypothetical protein
MYSRVVSDEGAVEAPLMIRSSAVK